MEEMWTPEPAGIWDKTLTIAGVIVVIAAQGCVVAGIWLLISG